jgi:hypothetical protein
MDAAWVPSPGRLARIKLQKTFFCQSGKELDCEERIAGGLLMHKPYERFQPLRVLVKTLGDEPTQISAGQRAKYDISHDRSLLADQVQHPHKRMGRTHLVVPVCADQQQIPDFRVSD